jgi:hypothetical protein
MPPASAGALSCARRDDPVAAGQFRRALGRTPTDPIPRCWSWRCPGCATLLGWGIRRYVQAGAYEAALHGWDVLFWTLTERGRPRTWDASSAALSRLMHAEGERFRRRGEDLPRYVAVSELQRRGATHWHGLTAIPHGAVGASSWRTSRAWHDRAWSFGFGFEADVQLLEHADLPRTAGYVAKYVTKDQAVADSVTDRFRRVRASTGQRRWWSYATARESGRRGVDLARVVKAMRAALEDPDTVLAG